ncbi:MAG TPA: hypothetical protein VM531_11350 [Sphingomicrobium sp.]|nr:hypothetical protein [Sphingomicrobium sp.]
MIWTDELADKVSRDARPADEATLLAWACVCVGPLIVVFIIGVVLHVWR